MNKLLASTLIASAVFTSFTPSIVEAAKVKALAVKTVESPVKLLNARATDQHLYYTFAGELLVNDSGTTKQVSIVVGNQVIDAKYKSTREDGKEIWSFSLGFNRNQLFTENVLTFAIRYKLNGKTTWDTNSKYRITDNSPIIFGDTVIKAEKASYDWTFNSVDGTIVTKNVDKQQGVTVTYTTDNWLTRKVVIAKLKDTNKDTGLQRWSYSLETDGSNVGVQYFVVLNTPQKTYVDNNAGLGYNIYR